MPGSRLPVGMIMDDRVRYCEAALGGYVHTMRAVVLHDMTFADVAMQRFGIRDRERIVIGKGGELPRTIREVVPRSGRHREIVREEFYAGLKILVNLPR